MHGFEGTYLGDASKLKDTDCLECKVCHYVYDPEKGDIDQNIEPSTPFSQLPDYIFLFILPMLLSSME